MSYEPSKGENWNGRQSDQQAYFHEIVNCIDLSHLEAISDQSFAILGYACDEGVSRNEGRIGAKNGPKHIRNNLAKIANHLNALTRVYDVGDIVCDGNQLEKAQDELRDAVKEILNQRMTPIVLGGGHDMALGHYRGIAKHLADKGDAGTIGIINFDAHFDLRKLNEWGSSGTPFYQIAEECTQNENQFKYLCLGVQPLSNIAELYQTADRLGVSYIEKSNFNLSNFPKIETTVRDFIKETNYIYLTIDLDGFSAAIAPGVSATSPFGFDVETVLKVLAIILSSGKLISFDLAELNPKYDIDNRTAKLAAYLIGDILHGLNKR